ncbi:hypothetical protein EVG20_g10307 [Dentipellis fragilis]|uniref:Nuclear distribution protein PAC1 n=1 Tax=Dentipellis fragilis TaxID=205917 RepID=A0A4Y9XUE8_9AGAM|nr:hypothetical protein EVG20_g10307 [Dentipellis fragilis]
MSTRPTEYFQIGGYMSHSHFWYQWDQAKLVKDFMGMSEKGIDLVYGIKSSGASYILLPVEDFRRIEQSLRLKWPKKPPFIAQDFISLSPIHFSSPQEFTDKLNYHKIHPKKTKYDSSKANNAFSNENSGVGYSKAAYEFNRLFYHLLQGSVDPGRFGLVRSSTWDSVAFFSFTFNIWLPEECPTILDLGFTSASLSSSQLQFKDTVHIQASENRTMGNPGTKKTEFQHGETVVLDQEARSARLQSIFSELQGSGSPVVIFVFNEDETKTILNQHGISTSSWQSGIEALLRSGRDAQRYSGRGDRFSGDPRYGGDPYRRRSQSPRREYQSNYNAPRRRSPSPTRVKPESLAGEIFIVDILQLSQTANSIPLHGRRPLAKAAEVLGLNVNSKVWCAGNESHLLVDMWKAIASGRDIGDRLRGATGAVAEQQSLPSSFTAAKSAEGPSPDEDSDIDPNDIQPNVATSARKPSMASYMDDFDMIDEDEDGSDDGHVFEDDIQKNSVSSECYWGKTIFKFMKLWLKRRGHGANNANLTCGLERVSPTAASYLETTQLAMALLSERQKDELHKSMLEYLHANNFTEAYSALAKESGTEYTPDPKAKYVGLLEKKWTSVIRLQKKIMDLENRNSALQEELSLSPAKRAASQTDWVPRSPAAHVLTGHRSPVSKVAFHPTYSLLASASEDATVKIWDWETGEFERTLKGHTKAVQDVDFDHKGNLLVVRFAVTCSSDMFIKIWDSQNEWKNTKTFPGHEHVVSSVRFLPGDQQIVSASRDRTIRVFDVASTHLVRTINGHGEWVRCITPSDDGRLLASCSNDQTARIWDPLTGESKMELRGHDHVVEVVVFAPTAAYKAIRVLAGLPDNDRTKRPGAYVVTGSRDKTIKLWDTQSGQMLRNFPGHDNWIRGLVFHPSGKYLLSASDDKTIRVWDLATGRCMKTVEAHGHFVTCIAWGRKTASGGNEPKVNGSAAAAAAAAEPEKLVNVVATASVDQTIKIWLP